MGSLNLVRLNYDQRKNFTNFVYKDLPRKAFLDKLVSVLESTPGADVCETCLANVCFEIADHTS